MGNHCRTGFSALAIKAVIGVWPISQGLQNLMLECYVVEYTAESLSNSIHTSVNGSDDRIVHGWLNLKFGLGWHIPPKHTNGQTGIYHQLPLPLNRFTRPRNCVSLINVTYLCLRSCRNLLARSCEKLPEIIYCSNESVSSVPPRHADALRRLLSEQRIITLKFWIRSKGMSAIFESPLIQTNGMPLLSIKNMCQFPRGQTHFFL